MLKCTLFSQGKAIYSVNNSFNSVRYCLNFILRTSHIDYFYDGFKVIFALLELHIPCPNPQSLYGRENTFEKDSYKSLEQHEC